MTAAVLNTNISEVENKTPDHAKYITSQEFNKFTAEHYTPRLKQTDLVSKTDFDNKLKRSASNKANYLEVQKKLNSLITKDYHFFLGRIYCTRYK